MKYEWISLKPEDTTYLDCWYHTYDNLSYTCHLCGMPVDIDQYEISSHVCRYCGKYQFRNKRDYYEWEHIYYRVLKMDEEGK